MLVNMILPILNYLIIDKIMIFLKNRKVKKLKHQYEMNKMILPEEYTLTNPYANSLNSIFITLIFGPGMPILIPICFVTLFI